MIELALPVKRFLHEIYLWDSFSTYVKSPEKLIFLTPLTHFRPMFHLWTNQVIGFY